MYKFKVPATSANLGIGFDCMGMALNLYDYFEVEKSDKWYLEGFLDNSIKNNLFVESYKKACQFNKTKIIPLRVKLKADVPSSRGLGSSSCLIVGGVYAYSILNNDCLTKDMIFNIARKIEGHPDNVAPAIYGGLCVINDNKLLKLKISNKWHFGLLIPNYEVKTADARKVLKDDIRINDAVNNVSSAIIALNALVKYKRDNINLIMNDKIHEPYRKSLIKNYDYLKRVSLKEGAKAFIISGSGSTCLTISDKVIDLNIKDIKYKKVKVDIKGVRNV